MKMTTIWEHGTLRRSIALVAVLFGLLTLKEAGAVLLGDPAARSAANGYVPFVLWFNFLAGFGYIAAGVGLWLQRRWAAWLAAAIAITTVSIFAAFAVHISLGGAYAQRTVVAMTLRTLVWTMIATWAWQRRWHVA